MRKSFLTWKRLTEANIAANETQAKLSIGLAKAHRAVATALRKELRAGIASEKKFK